MVDGSWCFRYFQTLDFGLWNFGEELPSHGHTRSASNDFFEAGGHARRNFHSRSTGLPKGLSVFGMSLRHWVLCQTCEGMGR